LNREDQVTIVTVTHDLDLAGQAAGPIEGRQGADGRPGRCVKRGGSRSLNSLKVGLGLPNADRTLQDGRVLVDIASRAEALGFSSLATLGRIAYPSFEELLTLAAAAAVTQRIGLMTDVLLAPAREPVLLAKQAATLDQISGGRFVLGIGVGNRPDDYSTTGREFKTRGRRLDAELDLMHRAWRGEPVPGTDKAVLPRPVNGHSVPTMYGGRSEHAIERTVRYGIGYTLGGGNPEGLKGMMERVGAAWTEAGRTGKPQFRALGYFALGDEAQEEGRANLMAYYGDYGAGAWQGAVKSAAEAKERVKAFEAAGCDELLLFMTTPSIVQAERLAEAVL
jgi:alkanesulfonate monooxygenase SsuD/methylene tetrahydromethanopterin reductase-like flavin-dependent oxidoreductase (luciferase family)